MGPVGRRVLGGILLLLVAAAARIAVIARTVSSYAAYWERRADRQGELLYVALGDSLAQGIGARAPNYGYVDALADRLAARTGRTVRVVNLSSTGAQLGDVLATQLPKLAALPGPDLLSVTIGTNDAGRTPPEAFRAAFTELCGALPDGALVADLPVLRRRGRGAAATELSAICREVLAAHPALRPVAIQAATTGMRIREYDVDLFHPSDLGYRRYAAAFVHAYDRRL